MSQADVEKCLGEGRNRHSQVFMASPPTSPPMRFASMLSRSAGEKTRRAPTTFTTERPQSLSATESLLL
jgi:hypothetical protein